GLCFMSIICHKEHRRSCNSLRRIILNIEARIKIKTGGNEDHKVNPASPAIQPDPGRADRSEATGCRLSAPGSPDSIRIHAACISRKYEGFSPGRLWHLSLAQPTKRHGPRRALKPASMTTAKKYSPLWMPRNRRRCSARKV